MNDLNGKNGSNGYCRRANGNVHVCNNENPKWISCTCSTPVPNLFLSSRGFERANVLWLLSRIPFPLHTIFYVIERKWICESQKDTIYMTFDSSNELVFCVCASFLHPSIDIDIGKKRKELKKTAFALERIA